MHHWRSVITVAGTGLALGLSLVLLATVIGWGSPWIALLVMFNFLGLAKLAEPLFVLELPAGLDAVRRWENEGTFYRQLGVRQFGALLRNTPLRYLNTGVYLQSAGGNLNALYRHASHAEASHFWAALAFTPYIAYLTLSDRPSFATGFLLIQVLFNMYPILHLRLLRSRLDSILRRQSARSADGSQPPEIPLDLPSEKGEVSCAEPAKIERPQDSTIPGKPR